MITLSQSKLDKYMRCPAMFYFIYVIHVPSGMDYHRLVGKGVHKMVARFHKEGNSINPFYFQSVETAVRAWWHEWFTMLEENSDKIKDRTKANDYKFGQSGKRCIQSYWKQTYGKQSPLHVEKQFSALLGDVRLLGVFDQVREVPTELLARLRPDLLTGTGELLPGYLPQIILDVKTGFDDYTTPQTKTEPTVEVRARHQFALHEDLQATIYTYIFKQIFGQLPLGFVYYYVRDGRFFLTFRTLEDFKVLEETVSHVLLNLENSSFPKKPGKQCKWCDYFKVCRGERDLLLNIPVTEMDWVKKYTIEEMVSEVEKPVQLKLGLKVKRPKRNSNLEFLTANGDEQGITEIPSFQRNGAEGNSDIKAES